LTAMGDGWSEPQRADGAFYAVDRCLPFSVVLRHKPNGKHARRERVVVGPALPIRIPLLGLLRSDDEPVTCKDDECVD